MKYLFTIFIFLLIGTLPALAQLEVEFSFANAQNTNDGTDDFYEVDILISNNGSGTDLKLGSSLLYFNYNTAAFGTNVSANNNIEFSYPNGSDILGEHENTGNADLYFDYSINDNSTSRVAFSWQQLFAAGVFVGDNVTSTAAALFHMKIKYVNVAQSPGVSFETAPFYLDQTFTACGPFGSIPPFSTSDCSGANAGTQITNDFFDSSGAALGGGLPVEWLFFNAEKNRENVDLLWATATEINASHFEIERSDDGEVWKKMTTIAAAGNTTQQQNYKWIDTAPFSRQNYYRILQVDLDGKFEYSDIISIYMENSQQDISIFPNPTKEAFTISFEKEIETVVRLFNSTGNLVLEKDISERVTNIPTNAFPSGIYYVHVIQQGKPVVQRLTLLE